MSGDDRELAALVAYWIEVAGLSPIAATKRARVHLIERRQEAWLRSYAWRILTTNNPAYKES